MDEAAAGPMSGALGEDSDKAHRGTLFGKFNQRVQDAIQQGRGQIDEHDSDALSAAPVSAEEESLSLKERPQATARRMVVPDGVVIEGALRSSTDADIAGKVEGSVSVDSRLQLGPGGVITGEVRTARCELHGTIEGKTECAEDLEIGPKGVLSANAIAGRRVLVAGTVLGNVNCGGQVILRNTANVTGNIRARSLSIEEGAVFNGACSMAKPKSK